MINLNAKYNFTKLEQSVIQELLNYSMGKQVETARILKDNKNITGKFNMQESLYRVLIKPKGEIFPCQDVNCPIFNQAKTKFLLKNATYIHYHPKPLPLSFGDVLYAFSAKLEKIVAVFDDGRYSIFCPNKNAEIPKDELLEGNKKIRDIIQKYGEDYILKNPINFSKYKLVLNSFLQNLANKTNSKYVSNM